MPIRRQEGTAGRVFHVINRGVRRLRLFEQAGDYRAWLVAFAEAHQQIPLDVFAYCLMPNHFHLILRPARDGDLAEFMRLGCGTHSKRWHECRGTRGTGAVYQGRYRAFPIASDRYFYNACRYVESNALRARLVVRAEDWAWSTASVRGTNCNVLPLAEWPILQPRNWIELVNQIPAPRDLADIRACVVRSAPFGPPSWAQSIAEKLHQTHVLRPPGRPRKTTSGVVS